MRDLFNHLPLRIMMARETVLILANGDWTESKRLRSLLASSDHVIAADGGYSKALAHGVHVDEVVGDLDSIPEPERRRLIDAASPVVSAFPCDKNWTDLDLAVDHALRRSPARIILFGALGDRIDQSLTNLHLLEKGHRAGVPILLAAGRETAQLVAEELVLGDVEVGDRVSLIPFSESVTVETDGLRFPLRGERLHRAASRGVSNEVELTPVRIRAARGLLLVVHVSTKGGGDD